MADVILSDKLLAGLAGWEVVKQARTIVAEDRVLSSSWEPPLLRGVVQSGPTSYRAGLVIRRENDAENLCTCRQSREWGTLCPHSIAVGLHALKPPTPPPSASPQSPPATSRATSNSSSTSRTSPRPVPRDARRLERAEPGAPGEPLTLHVILPPQLADALARGKVTVFFEGHSRRSPVPLASLPLDTPFSLSPEDARLLDAAELLAGGDSPALLTLSPTDFAELLPALADHPRVTFGKKQPVTVSGQPWAPPLRATLQPTGEIVLQLAPLPRPPALIPGTPPWILDGSQLQPLLLPPDTMAVLGSPRRFTRPQVPAFLSQTYPALLDTARLEANFTPADFELTPEPPRFHLHLAGGLATLTAHLQCQYGPRILTVGLSAPDEDVWLPDPAHPRRYATRDPAAERAALQRLLQHGFTGPDRQGRLHLHGQNPVLTFFARAFTRLEREWNVTLEERLQLSTDRHLERVEPRFAITPSGEQWFDLQVAFQSTSGERLSTADLQRLLRGSPSQAKLRNGRIALLDSGAVEELEEILVDCDPQQESGRYRIAQTQAGFVQSSLHHHGWNPVAPEAWRQRVLQATGEIPLTCPSLGALDAILRPYQKHGVAWLQFLRLSGFGGILADEMGLGKTLQALALFHHLHTSGSATRPHLVVCPTSLVSNWSAEAARFTPQLRVLAIEGGQRHSLFPRIPQSQLVITSYALLRRDFERYRTLEFDTVLLDEAQHIKNRETRNAQAVKAVRSRHRLVLTGTPLENSVLDLWSLFDFLMPGYLGQANDFRERYELPIVRERSADAQARLARRVRPFLLRRLKREVAPELPPRIDQVVWCDLSETQAAVYRQLLEATRSEVTQAVDQQGLARSRMLVLTAILRLRQASCDLRLLDLPPTATATEAEAETPASLASGGIASPSDTGERGGKLAAFGELLEEVLDGGHRVLVFSQFTRMLSLLKQHLDERDLRYAYLDGSTKDRGKVVASFQQSPAIPVFLISLKAGGVGLNLTGADTVVHFDPWWNPAVEDQATDRAHRIGQNRVVTSYKLIARGTVEEKILALQQRKRELLRGVLAGEETLSESLSWEEIQDLLTPA
jgi:superfamily II DNA or RNA helicase